MAEPGRKKELHTGLLHIAVAYTGLAAVAPTAAGCTGCTGCIAAPAAGPTVVEHIVAVVPTVLVPGTVTAAAPTVTGQARYS